MDAAEKEIKILGVLDKIIYKNEDNNYHVLNVGLKNLKDVKITITQPGIFEGLTYEFKGTWDVNAKYGKQFKAIFAAEKQPSTKEGLRAYLQSSFFNGIGPVIANRIVEHFGDDIIGILNENPNKLLQISGISKNKLQAIKEAWEKNKAINNIMAFLQQYDISTLYATKIYEFYGNDCVNQLKNNPYRLITDISGVGFSYADKIALQLGFSQDSPERVKACINYILEHGNTEGHCYLTESQITLRSAEVLQVNIKELLKSYLSSMEKAQEIKVLRLQNEESRFYSRKIYFNETYCAEKTLTLLKNNIKTHIYENFLNINDDKIKLSDEQILAAKGILGHGISILTGGAGVGKTQTLKKILDALNFVGKKISVCAPTGKASQRIQDLTGYEAVTIHRLLSWDHANNCFLKNEFNPIDADFIVCDESSMNDINLMSSLLRATQYDTQILFCGDDAQIFPVGPGNPFKDLIDSGIVPIYKLTKIFRQVNGNESLIITHSNEIRNGIIPRINNPLINPKIWKNGSDCLFIDSDFRQDHKNNTNYPESSSLKYGLDIEQMLVKLYIDILPKYYPNKEIQILIPLNIGKFGNNDINKKIQEILNPHSSKKNEISLKDKIFRVNDKVMQIKNNYDLGEEGIMNGSVGTIISINADTYELVVKFQNNNTNIIYKKSDIFDLNHAWSISIHRFQGSECDIVILPILNQYHKMLERRIYYTGITRSRQFCVFIGQRKALETAVLNDDSLFRQTSLRAMLLDSDFAEPL